MKTETMTRKARCLATIKGEYTDRAPRYIPGFSCEVASRMLGRKVNLGTGSLHYAEACALVQGENATMDFHRTLYEDLAELFRLLDIDVFRVPWLLGVKPTKQIDEVTFLYGDLEGDYTIKKYFPETADYGPVEHVRKNATDDPVESLLKSLELKKELIESGKIQPAKLDDEHKFVCDNYGDEFFVVCNAGGVGIGYDENMLMALMLAPDLVREMLMMQAKSALDVARELAQSPYPRVLIAGGDMASNDGPLFSPALFRAVHLPVLKYLMKELNELDVHYVFRTDGNMWPVSDMLFKEANCPGYGEVDRDASMTIGALREKYPTLITWGNMSCGKVHLESEEWVRKDSLKCIEESAGTRYFHGCSNSIMQGTPLENVKALFSV